MNSNHSSYHERLLHWIWENRHFNYQQLFTAGGEKIIIHDTGKRNKSDGPDFLRAEISIGNLRWHGNVEIHWKLSDWKNHGHDTDSNFNQVILHVVFEETDQTISRENQTTIPTLSLSPFLEQPLQTFVEQYQCKPKLPCSGPLTFISEEAFSQQIQKAHKEYFEQKVNDLLKFYDPQLVPSAAWLKMLTINLFDGLGISHNRAPMRKLAAKLFPKAEQFASASAWRKKAVQLSEINTNRNNSKYSWNHKGMRPNSHPLPRIQQGADCLRYIKSRPFEEWMRQDPEKLWSEMVDAVSVTPSLGRERADILFGTVFLPALYSLGNLFFSKRLKSESWELWQQHQVSLPHSLLQLLEHTDLPPSVYAHKLGTIYQLRNYCRPKNCQDCKVFKSTISS